MTNRVQLAQLDPALTLGPLDGRYRAAVAPLADHLSEAALNRNRLHVEVEWFIHLARHEVLPGLSPLAAEQEAGLRAFLEAGNFEAFTTNFEDLGGLRQLPGLAVQRLMAEGYSNREIAGVLYLAEGTVKNHVSTILVKFSARDRTNAVLRALHAGILR